MLAEAQRQWLLRVAREAIERHLHGEGDPDLPDSGLPDASGVFVTIKIRGELRGCLGVLEMRAPLVDEVVRCARDSATLDPRFLPLTADELPSATIDISILGPLEEIDPAAADAFTIGRHGLVVEQGHRRGLLLPQVAVEWGWTSEEFLAHTCRKAGLPADGWRKGAKVFRFDAEVFGE
ncbi:MAG TPA: AmmeMemoRadiSam system protein A [Vicinamibacterales bacterium]